MRILFVTNSLSIYSEVWLRRHIDILQNHLCAIACFESNIAHFNEIPVLNLNPRLTILNRLKSKLFPASEIQKKEYSTLKLLRSIKKYSADIVFIEYMANAVYFKNALLSLNIPVVIHCHGYDITWNMSSHEKPDIGVFNTDYLSDALELSRNAYTLANSKFTYQNLLNIGFIKERLFLKYLGVPTPPLSYKPITATDFTILYVGRLIDCKGPDLLIQAFEEACCKGLKAKLIIAGDGPLWVTCQLIRARCQFKESIHLLGKTTPKETLDLMQKANVFSAHNNTGLLSKQTESFGVSIIEAMSMGIPVVTGKSGGITETVVDGITGLLFEPGDIHQHAECLLKLYQNPGLILEMGENARHRVTQCFSLEAEKRNFEKLFSLFLYNT